MAVWQLAEPVLDEDVRWITEASPWMWEALRGATIFLTGGTGFFGCWLLLALARADVVYALDLRVIVLSRNPKGFARLHPEIAAARAVTFLAGDV
ncbi:hypothetical protein, partial [Desulfovibrio sp. TomC]|uniref:hypothetical protein n=1 Tax=Desulfovibrio sp. TomC TaxID=1562888 RepID=UPI0018CD231F